MSRYGVERSHFGFTLREVTAVVVITVILLLIVGALRPWSSRCGPISTKLLCGSNLKGLGTSLKIYANENLESWPVPGFDKTMVGKIDYRVPVGGGDGTPQSPNRLQESVSNQGGANALTTSRALWMLVRSGYITKERLICPQSGDVVDPTNANHELYYDFSGWTNLSYGYQVPYGPNDTKARDRADSRVAFAADKGPYRDGTISVPPPGIETFPTKVGGKTWEKWVPYNSQNHVGDSQKGQQVLFTDGHVEFKLTPLAGVDEDNIYTIQLDTWTLSSRIVGESPWLRSSPPFSSTDSVIFP